MRSFCKIVFSKKIHMLEKNVPFVWKANQPLAAGKLRYCIVSCVGRPVGKNAKNLRTSQPKEVRNDFFDHSRVWYGRAVRRQ